MSEDPGYRSGRTPGGMAGCLSAALFAVALFGPFTLGMTLGDCLPQVDCHAGDGPVLLGGLLIALTLGAGFGFVMRAILNLVHPPLGATIGDWPAAALLTLAAVPLSIAAGWYTLVLYVETMIGY